VRYVGVACLRDHGVPLIGPPADPCITTAGFRSVYDGGQVSGPSAQAVS